MNPMPVLVCGAPFSGSSLVAQMLGGHPALYATPELRLGMADDLTGLLEVFRFAQWPLDEGLLRLRAQLQHGQQDDRSIAEARTWLARQPGGDSAALLAELSATVAPRALVIPDSEAALRPVELLRWLQWAPGLRVVQCVRHPLTHGTVWAAWLRQRMFVPLDARDNAFTPAPGQLEPQIAWLRALGMVERWVPPAQRHVLCLERLETEPAAAFAELFDFLDVTADGVSVEELLRLEDRPFAGPGPATAPGGLEAEVLEDVLAGLALPEPVLEASVPWRDPSRPLSAEVVAAARALGYT